MKIENQTLFDDYEYEQNCECYSLLERIRESDPSITELILENVDVDNDFFESFCEALGRNQSITKLGLINVRVGKVYPDDPMNDRCCKLGLWRDDLSVFFINMEDNTTLESLILDGCHLCSFYANMLQEFVEHHQQLMHLQLHNITIDPDAEEDLREIETDGRMTLLEFVNIKIYEKSEHKYCSSGRKLNDYYLKKIYDADIPIGFDQFFI